MRQLSRSLTRRVLCAVTASTITARRALCAALLAGVLAPRMAAAQARGVVAGQVTAQNGQPIAGARITLAGTTLRASTSETGAYRIANVPAGAYSIMATMLGYSPRTQRVTVSDGQTSTTNFSLEQAALQISGVVVTATGREQSTREIGSSVGVLNTENVQLAPITSTTELLQGKVAGVVVSQSSGTAGSGARVRIRGANSMSLSNAPLIVIDGSRVENTESGTNALQFGVGGQTPSRLNDLSPEDIETIEVLKGPAAAALYGTAAANGVIQITTKRGQAGRSEFRVWSELGQMNEPARFPDNVYAVGNVVRRNSTTGALETNPVGLSRRCDIVRQAIGANPIGTQVGCTGITATYTRNPLEDPLTRPYRYGNRQTLGGSVSGGSESMTFYVSSDYAKDQGITPLNGDQRVHFQANTTGRLGDKLSVGTSLSYLDNRTDLPNGDNALYGITPMGLFGSANPATPAVDQGFQDDPAFFYDWKTNQNFTRLNGSLRGDYHPLSWLSFNGNAGIDRYAREDRNFLPRDNAYGARYGDVYTNGFIQSATFNIYDLTTNASGTAIFDLKPNLISTTSAGSQYIRESLHEIYAFGAGLTPGIETSLAGATSDFNAGETNTLNATLSAYLQQQLAWRDRVFLNAAIRTDKNTAFGQNVNWISYPSVSASWIVSDESFFPRPRFLNSLRLRAAYGQAGLRPGPTDALQAFSSQITTIAAQGGNEDAAAIIFGDLPTTATSTLGNPALKPERTSETELGFESQLLNNRAGLEVNYYNKTSRDALIRKPLPPSVGSAASRFENLGRVDNRGLEYRVNVQALRTKNLEWNAGINGAFTHNELKSLGVDAQGKPIPDVIVSSVLQQRHREGYPLGSYFPPPIVSYNDANGDGLLSPSEVVVRADTAVYAGNPFPTHELSFNTDLRFGDFVRVSALIDHKGGQKLLNQTAAWRCSTANVGNCAELYDRNTPLDRQAAIIGYQVYRTYAGWIEDASFTKLREVAVTLSVPQRFSRRVAASTLSVTLAGRNLKTWTKYTGLDPEVNYNGQSNFSTADFGTLPASRLWQLRIDAGF